MMLLLVLPAMGHFFAPPVSSSRKRMLRMMMLLALLREVLKPGRVIPGLGAEVPSSVVLLLTASTDSSLIVPATLKVTRRPLWLTASRNDPGPESSRLVTV